MADFMTPGPPTPLVEPKSWNEIPADEQALLLNMYRTYSEQTLGYYDDREVLRDIALIRKQHMHGICQFYLCPDGAHFYVQYAVEH